MNERSTQLEKWFKESYDDLLTFAYENLPDVTAVEESFTHIANNHRRCRAKTRAGYLIWACNQIAKQPGFVRQITLADLDLDVLEFLDSTVFGASRYRDFEYQENPAGNAAFVLLGSRHGDPLIWKLPIDRYVNYRDGEMSWFEFARRLWPCHARLLPDGRSYVAKKIKGKIVPLHRIFLDVDQSEIVKAYNRDMLDWTLDNLYTVSDGDENISAQERQERFEGSLQQIPQVMDPETGEKTDDPRCMASNPALLPAEAGRNSPANADLGRRYALNGRITGDNLREDEPVVPPVPKNRPAAVVHVPSVTKLSRAWGH